MATLGTKGDKVVSQLGLTVKEFFTEVRADINKASSWSTSLIGLDLARSIAHPRLRAKIEALQERFKKLQVEGASADKLAELQRDIELLHKRDLGRSLFERLGYNETGYNTQTKFEINTVDNNMRKTMQVFAAAIGLRSITDGVRVAALTTAVDTLISRVTILQNIPKSERTKAINTGQGMTVAQAQALKELQTFGMDVGFMLEAMDNIKDPSDVFNKQNLSMNDYDVASLDNALQQNILTTLSNMLDSKVVNPQAHNLPKYYHDPRFRIITAMTRFVATLHATVLPRLYKDYILNGSAGMRYQAFSVIAMALTLAMLANMMKDELSYGEENPYLTSTKEKVQRTIYGSGLLGRLEGAVDAVSPLYPDRRPDPTRQPIGYAYDVLKDQSPVISYGDRLIRGVYNVGTGETEQGVKQLTRSLPLAGSFPVVADFTSEQFKE
jgi:hypothetical protein